MSVLTDIQRRDCLAADPFAGDFGGSDDRVLSDRIVTAAKRHVRRCQDCDGDIEKGEQHRSRSEIVDGEMRSYRWCHACCVAMAVSWGDDGRAWEARTRLGFQRRAEAAETRA